MIPIAPQELLQAAQARNSARKAVTDWMDQMSAQGLLRSNRDAPGWSAYVEAERALEAAVQRAGLVT